MTEDSAIPLSECLMIGIFQPVEYLHLPTRELCGALDGWRLARLRPAPVFVLQGEAGPVYRLAHPEDAVGVFFGPNAVGVSFQREAYHSWETCRDRGIELLTRAQQAFGARPYHSLTLKFIDVFRHNAPAGLHKVLGCVPAGALGAFGGACDAVGYSSTIDLAGSSAAVDVRVDVAPADDEVDEWLATVELDIRSHGVADTPGDDAAAVWWEAAHTAQKELLWAILAPEFRQRHGALFFDEDERRKFQAGERER